MNTVDSSEVIDIAEYSAKNTPPPKGQRYRFLLDKQPYVSDQEILTGAQILGFGGLAPDQYDLFQAIHGGQRIPVAANAEVDLTEPGIERFFTMKNAHTNGYETGRREFELPAEDLAYLVASGLAWETIRQANATQQWLIIRDWPLPPGLNVAQASVALRIDANYPMTQIDMAYFQPMLTHAAGKEIPSLTAIEIDGSQWQQWSRHRPADGWRPGIDGLESHLAYVSHFLAAAVEGV